MKELSNLLTKLLKVNDRLFGSCTLLLMSWSCCRDVLNDFVLLL